MFAIMLLEEKKYQKQPRTGIGNRFFTIIQMAHQSDVSQLPANLI